MSSLHLEKIDPYLSLFAFYSSLLTDTQKKYFEKYFSYNLSFQEIATLFKVSKNAVHDSIKVTVKLLDNYEKKLHLYKKYQARKKIYEQHSDCQFIAKLKEIDKI